MPTAPASAACDAHRRPDRIHGHREERRRADPGADGWMGPPTAPADALLKRLADGERRPLLRGDVRQNVIKLLDQRRPLYRDADLRVDVSVASPERVADAVLNFLASRERRTIPVRLTDRAYPVHVGDGILALLPVDLRAAGGDRQRT